MLIRFFGPFFMAVFMTLTLQTATGISVGEKAAARLPEISSEESAGMAVQEENIFPELADCTYDGETRTLVIGNAQAVTPAEAAFRQLAGEGGTVFYSGNRMRAGTIRALEGVRDIEVEVTKENGEKLFFRVVLR